MPRSSLLAGILFLAGSVLPITGALAQDAGNPDYDKRLQRLEEQIVDLNAQLGTVETMAQSGGATAAAPSGGSFPSGGSSFGGGDDGGKLSEIETQVRALSAQMGEIMRRLQRIEQRSGGLGPSGGSRQAQGPDAEEQGEQGTGFSISGDDKDSGGFGTSIEPRPGQNSGRGNYSGQPGSSGQPGGYSGGGQPSGDQPGGGQPGGTQGNTALSSSGPDSGAVRTAASSTPQARALYDQAHNALVQRNYRAASNDFEQFVQAYPSDPLAGSAYFWLGEASFTSGEYRKAADSFLKSSTNYPQNEKAAESLLKLGISLKRLGENKAACSSFAELARRFPSATPVLQRAEREKSRAQC